MPSILDLFKQANANGEVTMWNGGAQNKGLGGKVMDFVKAEINPKGPRVLFYKKLVTPPLIYGTETPRISLKGTVDPARSLATKSAKYNEDPTKKTPISLGSLLGGSANRPSDTIFESETGAPVTKGTLPASVGDHSALRYAVEGGTTNYFISKAPMGPNALSGVLKGDLNQMAGKAIGAGIGAAKKAIGKAVTNLVTKKRKKGQKGPKPPQDRVDKSGKLYGGGTKKSTTGNVADGNVKNSDYLTSYTGKIPTGVIERKGDYITVDDLIDEVGKDATRFIMLNRSSDVELDFDFDAVKEKSKDNPLYYVQYCYARISSVFRHLDKDLEKDINIDNYNFEYSADEIKILKKISEWPKCVDVASTKLEPHRIPIYLYELAAEFHSYWNLGKQFPEKRFINEQKKISDNKLIFLKAIANVIKSGMNIVGVASPSKM